MNAARFYDLMRILRAAGVSRTINYLALAASYALALITRKARRAGSPAFVAIEPTNRCNLQCTECPGGRGMLTRPKGTMEHELYTKILDEIAGHAIYLTLYFQGEPFMHPVFHEMVREAKSKGLYVATSTNAHFLDMQNAEACVRSGLDRIIISFDGPDASAYESYRTKGDWNKVTEGVRNLVDARKSHKSRTPFIILQCLVTGMNEERLDEVNSMFREVGADRLEFKTIQLIDPERPSALLPDNTRHSRYVKNGPNGYRIIKRLKNHCFRVWSSCVITWDGHVVPCCYDKDATHALGDLRGTPLRRIWRGQSAREFLMKVFTDRKGTDICRNCGE
jgi:radical SAM protein with 4Fe4S-binding SPASM domain